MLWEMAMITPYIVGGMALTTSYIVWRMTLTTSYIVFVYCVGNGPNPLVLCGMALTTSSMRTPAESAAHGAPGDRAPAAGTKPTDPRLCQARRSPPVAHDGGCAYTAEGGGGGSGGGSGVPALHGLNGAAVAGSTRVVFQYTEQAVQGTPVDTVANTSFGALELEEPNAQLRRNALLATLHRGTVERGRPSPSHSARWLIARSISTRPQLLFEL